MKPFNVVRKLSDIELPQLTVLGKVILDKDLEFRNANNDGEHFSKWIKPFNKTIKAGTTVDYVMMESRSAFHHTLRFREGNITWKLSKDTETFEGELPNTRQNYPNKPKYKSSL